MLRSIILIVVVLFCGLFIQDASAQNRISLKPGAFKLNPGEDFTAGNFKFSMLPDGNLILQTVSGNLLWSSNLFVPCSNCVASFDEKGRLAIRNTKTGRLTLDTRGMVGDLLVIQDSYPVLALYRKNQSGVDGFPVLRQVWEADVKPVGPSTFSGLRPRLAYPASLPPSYDFLVQDVCIDSDGLTTGEDPAVCELHRNIRIGEDVPYILSDWAWNQSYLHIFNVPAVLGNKLRIVNMKEFGKNSSAPDSIRAFGDFNPIRADGYDIYEADGEYASATGTQDPVTNNSRFFIYNGQCQKEDGWILFPNHLSVGEHGYTIATLRGGTCVPGNPFSQSLTLWDYYDTKRTFTNKKTLNIIQSFHFGGGTTGNLSHAEFFYFTREYGASRWERWESNLDLRPKYDSGNCNGVIDANFWNEPMIRYGCRDWTTFIPSR